MSRPAHRSVRRIPLLTALITGALLLAAVPAAPVTLADAGCKVRNVRTGVSGASVADAVTSASSGDTLEVRGTCTGTTFIDKRLTLVGKASTTLGPPILDGADAGRVLSIAAGRTVKVTGLTIRNGLADATSTPAGLGGAILNAGVLTLTRVIVRDSHAEQQGGGIHSTGTLTLATGTRVLGNDSTDGGGILVSGLPGAPARLTLTGDAQIRGNQAQNGAAIKAQNAVITLKGSASIHHNVATDGGGGLFLFGSTVDLFGTASIHDNRADWGGAIAGTGDSDHGVATRVRLHDQSSVAANSATSYASAIGMEGRMLMEDRSVVRGNTLIPGGGAVELWWEDGSLVVGLTMTGDSRIRGNTSGKYGAGVFVYDGCRGGYPRLVGLGPRVVGNTPAQVAHTGAC